MEVESLTKDFLRSCIALVLLLITGCSPSSPTASRDVRRDATVEAIERAMPSVVNIATTTIVQRAGDPTLEHLRKYFKWPVPTEGREEPYNIGSGVIVDEDGYLLTNWHVLENAKRIQVKLWNGEVYDARPLVGIKQKDVALLEIVAPPGKKFKAMKLARDDDLMLGESVIAVGNPFGLGGTVTQGILSSKNRRLDSKRDLDFEDWLQTDADINFGNSGGPLINLRGELIGINVAVGQGQGIGFAIPVKQISAALAEFYTPEAARGLWFGARIGSFNPPLTVLAVQPGSPAETAGLRVGQRVVSVNRLPPKDLVEFQHFVTAKSDHTATLEVDENGRRRSLNVQMVPFDGLIQKKLGARLRNITYETASAIGISPGEGVIIEEVEKDGPADKAKLQAGFVITGVGERRTGELLHAAGALSLNASGARVPIAFVVPQQFGETAGRYNTTVTIR